MADDADDRPDSWVAFWRGLHRTLSTRDADAASEVAMVVASHLSAGGSDVLRTFLISEAPTGSSIAASEP
jgi:hypothetical protein